MDSPRHLILQQRSLDQLSFENIEKVSSDLSLTFAKQSIDVVGIYRAKRNVSVPPLTASLLRHNRYSPKEEERYKRA